MTAVLPYLSLAISAVACMVAVWVAVRAGRWKESDDAKALVARIGRLEGRVDNHASRFDGLATKSDVATLSQQLVAVDRSINTLERGVERIEAYLMEKSK